MKVNKAFKTQQGRDEVIKYSDMLLEKLTIPYERLNLKAVVMGASLGAWLAAKFSIRYPEKIEKLVYYAQLA